MTLSTEEKNLKSLILEMSRQSQIGTLTPFFDSKLDTLIEEGRFVTPDQLRVNSEKLIQRLRDYSTATGVNTVTIGMSGGIDSALTATLFQKAGWTVIGYIMPIHQDHAETERGVEACRALGIKHTIEDLSKLYDATVKQLADCDPKLLRIDPTVDDEAVVRAVKVRLGNVRARLRMITLYNAASQHGGLVASTDNFSELTAGFWTLHGDVGDVSPIQGLNKSWEVPMMASIVGVPESIVRAKPTDGLGIDSGDEAQLGCSYLEWDIVMLSYIHEDADHMNISEMLFDQRGYAVIGKVLSRVRGSWFKRKNPYTFENPSNDLLKKFARWEDCHIVPGNL